MPNPGFRALGKGDRIDLVDRQHDYHVRGQEHVSDTERLGSPTCVDLFQADSNPPRVVYGAFLLTDGDSPDHHAPDSRARCIT
jgi:hypothetical protein